MYQAGSGPTASSSVNVGTAASVTGRLDGAAAATAGPESAVRKVRLHRVYDLLRRGNTAFNYTLQLTPSSAQRATQACSVPAAREDVGALTVLRVTTSPESVSVLLGGEENTVTKVRASVSLQPLVDEYL